MCVIVNIYIYDIRSAVRRSMRMCRLREKEVVGRRHKDKHGEDN